MGGGQNNSEEKPSRKVFSVWPRRKKKSRRIGLDGRYNRSFRRFFFLLLFSVERRERGRRKRRSRESRLDLIGYARYVFPPLHIRTRARHEWDDLLSTVFFEIRTNASLFSSYRSSVLLFVFANINMSVNTLWPTTFDGCVQPNKPVFSVTSLFELKSFRLSQCLVIDSSKFRDRWVDLNSHGPFNNFPNNNQKE